MKPYTFLALTGLLLFVACTQKTQKQQEDSLVTATDTIIPEPKQPEIKEILPKDIVLTKELKYEQYTLEDTYPYKDTVREFQWEQIKEILAKIENIQKEGPQAWGILQNRRNKNGEAPLVPNWSRNEYKNVADSLGVERFQGIPLHLSTDSVVPVRYGRDGELVRLTQNSDSSSFLALQTVYVPGDFIVPRKYVHIIDTIIFEKIAFVDRTNQNITTVERTDTAWIIRSMNPATTGQHNPPYAHDTPLGIFVVQEKKDKMYYLVDGTSKIAGYAPWASRFSNGGYIHGVPVNNPNGKIIEYSQTLGTIPRSHMCVRNASSHAKFVYDWMNVGDGLVVVIE